MLRLSRRLWAMAPPPPRLRARVWIDFYKKATGTPSLTWPESIDDALCYGWIDGKQRRVDGARHTIRFTLRRPRSHWSVINLRRVEVMVETRRMQPADLAADTARDPARADGLIRKPATRAVPSIPDPTESESSGLDVLPGTATIVSARSDVVGRERQAARHARPSPATPDRRLCCSRAHHPSPQRRSDEGHMRGHLTRNLTRNITRNVKRVTATANL